MVDALASGASELWLVEVQVLFSAPDFIKYFTDCFRTFDEYDNCLVKLLKADVQRPSSPATMKRSGIAVRCSALLCRHFIRFMAAFIIFVKTDWSVYLPLLACGNGSLGISFPKNSQRSSHLFSCSQSTISKSFERSRK